MSGFVQFTTNEAEFSARIVRYAEAAMITFEAAFEARGRSLCNRLIKLTPPLSGKNIKKSLWAREIPSMAGYKAGLLTANGGDVKKAFEQFAPFRDPEIEDMSARAIGLRRVEKDIRKVIKGVRGASMAGPESHPDVIVSQTNPRSATHSNQVEWGVRQKCQGIDAVRIYADRSGNVYGVDASKFLANPSLNDLKKIHQAQRTKRGRVTTAGSKDKIVGRWRWLNMVVAPADIVNQYIEQAKKKVGQARGGWVAGFKAFGGKISEKGWVGSHINAGTCVGWPPRRKGEVNVTITNNSAWASNGDPDRIVENSMRGVSRDTETLIQKALEKMWGEGAGNGAI